MMMALTVFDQIKPEHINNGGYASIIAVVKASFPWLGAVAKKNRYAPGRWQLTSVHSGLVFQAMVSDYFVVGDSLLIGHVAFDKAG